MSTTVTSTTPTAPLYQCGSGCGRLTFNWTKPMPGNGYLGTATFGQFVNKPIQVYGAEPILYNGHQVGLNWGFQAQDGSFLGRMYVSTGKCYIRFAHFRANDQWPQVSCHVPTPDPLDPPDIDKVP
ncbi:MAG TPA: hypothetical protein VE642_13855 [Pyrinomonadaceae bacterium]|jgi:hypothetical protein|nr:hypothetical protein [Pyrinomonadaceae bacterium]